MPYLFFGHTLFYTGKLLKNGFFNFILSFFALGTTVWRYCAYCEMWCHLCDVLTGFALLEAKAVKKTLDMWQIADKIIACGFDMDKLEDWCPKRLLHPPGRFSWTTISLAGLPSPHPGTHPESYLRNISEPPLVQKKPCSTSWSLLGGPWISVTSTCLPSQPSTFYKKDAASLFTFIDHCLEFLEFAQLILGGTIQCKKGYTYVIQQPWADIHARWMSKAIYTLKLTLLRHQFPDIPWHKKRKLEKMTFLILFVYLESWFRSSSLFSAASSDLQLHQKLLKFRKARKKLAEVGMKVLQRHTSYPGASPAFPLQQQRSWWCPELTCWEDLDPAGS